MENLQEQMGEGTLYDTGGNELATVAYRIAPTSPEDSDVQTWGGELYFNDPSMTVDPGLYVLATEDGTQSDIAIEPASATDGERRHVAFNGVGTFGQRVL